MVRCGVWGAGMWHFKWNTVEDKKKDKQESTSTIPEEVQEFVNLTITEHMGKAYSEWKLNQDKESVSEIDKKYQKSSSLCFSYIFLLFLPFIPPLSYTLSCVPHKTVL